MSHIVPDSSVRFSASVKNASGNLSDPTNISIQIFNPNSVQSASYLQGTDAELVKDATGLYHADYVIPGSPGLWSWKWRSTGSFAGAESGTFQVSASP
mgnify:CR=1 FL=1